MSIISYLMSQLNPQQLEAVKTINQPLLVLAGAGSGKTRVITEKIAHLIQQGTTARNIAALTFTNKAAREMKNRVSNLLDNQKTRGLRVSTFHSLGLDIIRKEYKALNYKAAISLFDEQDKSSLLRELINHNKKNYDLDLVDNYARQIGQWKNAFITAEQAKYDISEQDLPARQLYAEYTRSLKAYNAIDFDDLILFPVLLFQHSPATLEKWQNKIRYLLIDEYQDTNLTQYQLVKLLAGKLGQFTVVGDDDQSIYAWRGAQPENLAQLQKDFLRLKVIKLEQNYRSTTRILKVANQLIANNPHTIKKRLWSNLGSGERLRVLKHKDELSEVKQVVSEIVHHKFQTGGNFQNYAILYRGNHQSRLFERELRENNVPYFISGSTSFFAYAEIKDILSYLRLLVNQDDDAAFLRIINTPRREIGPTTLEKLGEYANDRHISLFTACNEFGLTQKLPENAIQKLQRFCNWIQTMTERVEKEDTFAVIEQFINTMGYETWLYENSKSPQSAERKIANVLELIEWLKKLANDENDSQKSLSEIIAKVMLLDILERNEEQEASEQISLMTLHAAKGLEFRHVFLIGFEENLLPHQNSIETNNIEEERRLAYVGITRAQQTCTFSYCSHRKRYGEIVESEPSRFLNELPLDNGVRNNRQNELDRSKQRHENDKVGGNIKFWLSEVLCI